MMPSPVKRSSVPSCARISAPIAAWYSRSTPITSSGSAVSVKAVKPRRSRNTTVISRRWLFSGSSAPPATISLGQLRREEALQPPEPLELRHLLAHALLERVVPLGQLRRLRLDLVLQRLDAQQRLHAREQLRLVDRLGEEVVGAGLDALDALLLRVERGAPAPPAAARWPGWRGSRGRRRSRDIPGIMTSSSTRSGALGADAHQRLLAADAARDRR